jgi:hypothetical protein
VAGHEALLLIALLATGVITWWLIARRKHQTVMGDHRPACANCLYPLGGWSSSRCPECGADVKDLGVRTGPQFSLHLLHFAVIILAFIIVVPLTINLFSWVFAQRQVHWDAQWTHKHERLYFVTLNVNAKWRRFPPTADFDQHVIVMRLPEQHTGVWFNHEWRGTAPKAKMEFRFNQSQPTPVASELLAAIEAVAPELSESARQKDAEEVAAELASLRTDIKEGRLSDRGFDPAIASSFSGGSGGSGGGDQAHWLSGICTLLAIIAAIFFPIRAINRAYKPGWRPARPEEWTFPRVD